MGALSVPPTGSDINLYVKYTPLNGLITDTSFNLLFTPLSIVESFYNGSVSLKKGDRIHIYINYNTTNLNQAHDLTVQLDLF
jgi:hypothetical protein